MLLIEVEPFPVYREAVQASTGEDSRGIAAADASIAARIAQMFSSVKNEVVFALLLDGHHQANDAAIHHNGLSSGEEFRSVQQLGEVGQGAPLAGDLVELL